VRVWRNTIANSQVITLIIGMPHRYNRSAQLTHEIADAAGYLLMQK
jgi:hypothetical protein